MKAYKIRFVGVEEEKLKEELEKIAKKEQRSLKKQMIYIFQKFIEEKKNGE